MIAVRKDHRPSSNAMQKIREATVARLKEIEARALFESGVPVTAIAARVQTTPKAVRQFLEQNS